MLNRDRGHIQAEQAAGLPCVVAGGADHVLGNDVAPGCRQLPFAGGRAPDRGAFRLLLNLCAARPGPSALRKGARARPGVAHAPTAVTAGRPTPSRASQPTTTRRDIGPEHAVLPA